MKKLIFMAGLLTASASHAGIYADIAKSKFESEMVQAIQLMDTTEMKKNKAISTLPGMEKEMRNVVRAGLKQKKSCLKIKKDFVIEQGKLMKEEAWPDEDFAATSLSAMGDYVATVCLDMK